MRDQIQGPGHRWLDGLEMNEGSAEPREPARKQSKVKEFAMGQHGWPWQGSDLGLKRDHCGFREKIEYRTGRHRRTGIGQRRN